LSLITYPAEDLNVRKINEVIRKQWRCMTGFSNDWELSIDVTVCGFKFVVLLGVNKKVYSVKDWRIGHAVGEDASDSWIKVMTCSMVFKALGKKSFIDFLEV